MSFTLLQESNIHIFLQSLPVDIQMNITVCTEKWLAGETANGYPHPAQVCANHQSAHERQSFLSAQQALNLQILKSHLRSALQAI